MLQHAESRSGSTESHESKYIPCQSRPVSPVFDAFSKRVYSSHQFIRVSLHVVLKPVGMKDQRFEHFEILQPERSTGSFHMLFFDLRSASEFSRQPKPTECFKVFDPSRKKSKSRCLEKSPKTLDWIKQSMYVRHQQ
jgi:hypothetical protein